MENEDLIKEKYSILFQEGKSPDWALRKKSNYNEIIHPSIPFIGKLYYNWRILIYESTENLNDYTIHDLPIDFLDNDSIAINRHKYCFENYSKFKFYPYLGIGSVDNGALMIVASYFLYKWIGLECEYPYDLLWNLAIANFGKFSIQSKNDQNRANNSDFLRYSIQYIEEDLKILKPKIIIIPNTIWKHTFVKNIIYSIVPQVTVIPILPITPTTINVHIQKKYKKKDKRTLPAWMLYWHEKLKCYGAFKGKTNANFYSVYTYLDKVFKENKIIK